jgi:hypothetical protein
MTLCVLVDFCHHPGCFIIVVRAIEKFYSSFKNSQKSATIKTQELHRNVIALENSILKFFIDFLLELIIGSVLLTISAEIFSQLLLCICN